MDVGDDEFKNEILKMADERNLYDLEMLERINKAIKNTMMMINLQTMDVSWTLT